MIPEAAPFGRRLFRRVHPLIEAITQQHNADRYRKKFLARTHLWVLILHMASGSPSLRQTHARLGSNVSVRRRLGLEDWISFSQLARSSTSRSPQCVLTLLSSLASQARNAPNFNRWADKDWHYLTKVKAIDSTFLKLIARFSPWSVHGGYRAGGKVQCGLDLAPDLAAAIPEVLHLSTASTSDQSALEQLLQMRYAEWEGWTLLVDLGYYGHRLFAILLAHQIHFLCKLHPQATYRVLQNRKVIQKEGWMKSKDDEVLRDEIIVLGSTNNRKGAVLEQVRLVTARNPRGEECRFVTSRHDLEGWEVVELYRRRWDIELFFRWLKRQLGAVRPLGWSREAVWLTVLVGGVVALLWLLLASMAAVPRGMSRVAWLHAVADTLPYTIALNLRNCLKNQS